MLCYCIVYPAECTAIYNIVAGKKEEKEKKHLSAINDVNHNWFTMYNV